MSSLRLVIVAALAIVLAAAPLFPQGLATSSGDVSVYAATASSPLAGGGGDNGNGDNGNGNGDNGNGNGDNGNGNGDNGNGNGDNSGDNSDDNSGENSDDNGDGDGGPPPPPPPPAAAQVATTVSGCVANGQGVTLEFPGGTATVTNVIAQGINVRLERAAPAAGPQGQLDAIIFNAFFENCGGGALADPPPNVNLGIRYTVGANKAGLRIVTLQGNQFAEAGIVTAPDPDPNNPFISATIPARTAAYSVVQR